MAGLAEKLGMSQGDAAGQLSDILPGLIDKLTPQGQAPAGGLGNSGDLIGVLGGLLQKRQIKPVDAAGARACYGAYASDHPEHKALSMVLANLPASVKKASECFRGAFNLRTFRPTPCQVVHTHLMAVDSSKVTSRQQTRCHVIFVHVDDQLVLCFLT